MPHDVFISYGHLDNTKPDNNEGWVTNFHNSLKRQLSEYLGREALIWRDTQRMGVGDMLTDSIKTALLESLTIVCVVSPSYVVSPWCSLELQNFCNVVGRRLGNKSRVYYTVRLPFQAPPDNELLNDSDILSMNFYELDENGIPFALPPEHPRFQKNVNQLAYKISEMLGELRVVETSPPPAKKTVYLAKPTEDLNDDYKNVRDDLLRQKYIVLPSPTVLLPSDGKAFVSDVKREIDKCSLAVHLISKNYGVCPPPSDDPAINGLSYVHLQTRASAERDSDCDFSRLIWLPKDVEGKEDFTKELLGSASASNKVDVLRDSSTENLKTRIKDILEGRAMPPAKPQVRRTRPYVYVYCEESDADEVNNLEKMLVEKLNCEVFSGSSARALEPQVADSGGDSPDFLKQHGQFLNECQGVLIYWNTPLKFWVQITVKQFRKIFNPESLGVFFADERKDRDTYLTHEAQIIKSYDELQPFVSGLNLNLGGN